MSRLNESGVGAPWTDLDLWVERQATPSMAGCRGANRPGRWRPPSTGKAARSPPDFGRRAGKVTDPPLQVRGGRVTDGHAPCDAPFDRASLIHTDHAMGISAFAAVTSVPAWPAFAVVTRTSICLRLQATSSFAGNLPAQLTTPARAAQRWRHRRVARQNPAGPRTSSTRARATPRVGFACAHALERKAT